MEASTLAIICCICVVGGAVFGWLLPSPKEQRNTLIQRVASTEEAHRKFELDFVREFTGLKAEVKELSRVISTTVPELTRGLLELTRRMDRHNVGG